MDEYFKDVVNELTLDDMRLLGFLFDQDSTASFKAIFNNDVAQKCEFTEATFRKVLHRLAANKFIKVVVMKRQHSIFITHYGIAALKNTLLNEGVSA